LYLRFKRHLAVPPARLKARMDSLFSFPVGLSHPLQHAGLARRTPSCRPTGQSKVNATPLQWTSPAPATAHLRALYTGRWAPSALLPVGTSKGQPGNSRSVAQFRDFIPACQFIWMMTRAGAAAPDAAGSNAKNLCPSGAG